MNYFVGMIKCGCTNVQTCVIVDDFMYATIYVSGNGDRHINK